MLNDTLERRCCGPTIATSSFQCASSSSNEKDRCPGTLVRSLASPDIDSVVAIHIAAFNGFFLTFLGARFLRIYYRCIVDFGGLGFVAEYDRTIVGFVTGIVNDSGFYRRALVHRGLFFFLAALPSAARNPARVLPKLMGALRKQPSGAIYDRSSAVSLTSIAVLPNSGRKGIGHELIATFKREAARRGARRIYLETDAEEKNPAIQFYNREGFTICRTYTTHQGRTLHEFAIDL